MIVFTNNKKENHELKPGEKFVTVHGHEMVSAESYHGRVVYRGEHNYYDDSDFYAVVSVDGSFREIEYGTTRFWTYGNYCKVDAPPSLMKEYRDWKIRQDRRARMIEETRFWEKFNKDCGDLIAACDTPEKLDALESLYRESDRWEYVLTQVSHATRSKFNLSLKAQVLQWIDRTGQENNFPQPLSVNQFLAASRYFRPYRY